MNGGALAALLGPGAASGPALLAGVGAALLGGSLLPGRRGERAALPLAFLALGASLLLGARELLGGGQQLSALGRVLIAAGGLGTLLLGAQRAEGWSSRAAGLLSCAAAGLQLAVGGPQLVGVAAGWTLAVSASLGLGRVSGWVAPEAWRRLASEAAAGTVLVLVGLGLVGLGAGTGALARVALPVAGGAALVVGALLASAGLLLTPGAALPWGWRGGLAGPFLVWITGPLAVAGALVAARLLLPLAQAGPAAGPWRAALGALALLAAGSGALGALRARELPALVGGVARAQVGWLFLALAGLDPALTRAAPALAWQALAAIAGGACAFAGCALVAEVGGSESLAGLTGLGRRNAWLATWVVVPPFVLAGLPPGPAFGGRIATLVALSGALPVWVAALAALLLLPGLLVALRLARIALHGPRPTGPREPLVAEAGLTLWTGSLALLLLALGLAPCCWFGR